jgi:hypothetical protein
MYAASQLLISRMSANTNNPVAIMGNFALLKHNINAIKWDAIISHAKIKPSSFTNEDMQLLA